MTTTKATYSCRFCEWLTKLFNCRPNVVMPEEVAKQIKEANAESHARVHAAAAAVTQASTDLKTALVDVKIQETALAALVRQLQERR